MKYFVFWEVASALAGYGVARIWNYDVVGCISIAMACGLLCAGFSWMVAYDLARGD